MYTQYQGPHPHKVATPGEGQQTYRRTVVSEHFPKVLKIKPPHGHRNNRHQYTQFITIIKILYYIKY